jgi:tetratricopeptide (TPR) repeat protein
MMQGKFRWKAVLFLVLCSTLLGTGWFFLHRYQVKEMSGRYREFATRDEEKKNYDRALRFLRQYLKVKEDDADALARYGMLVEKLAQTPRAPFDALEAYERVLVYDGSRHDIRLRAAKLNMRFGRIDSALLHLQVLQKADAGGAEVDLFQGDCKTVKKEPDKAKQQILWKEAEGHYRRAISRAPDKIEAYARLARLLRNEQKKPMQACQVLEDLVRANSQDARAYLIRAEFRQVGADDATESFSAIGAKILALLASPLEDVPYLAASALWCPKTARDLPGAVQDLAQARELAPKDADVLLRSALQEMLLAREKGQAEPKIHFDKAREYLHKLPEDTRVLAQLANVEVAAGRRKEAADALRKAQEKASGKERNRLLEQLTVLLIDDNKADEANKIIGQMKKGGVPAYRLDYLKAKIAIRRGEWLTAVELLESSRPMFLDKPNQVLQVDLEMSTCYEQMGNADQQLNVCKRAKKIDALHPAARLGMARALRALGRFDEALNECQELRAALRLQAPIECDLLYARLLIHRNLRLPLSEAPDWDEVKTVLREAAQKNDTRARELEILQAETAFAQGITAEAQGRAKEGKGEIEEGKKKLEEAKENFAQARKILEQAKQNAPKDIEPWVALATLAIRGGGAASVAEATKIIDQAKDKFGDRPELRLAKLRCTPSEKQKALSFLRPLGEKLEAFDQGSQWLLLAGLAEAFERFGSLTEAEKSLQKLVHLRDKQLLGRQLLFDFYLRRAKLDGMEKTAEMIKEIDGKDGVAGHLAQAHLLIFRAGAQLEQGTKGSHQLSAEGKQLAAEARKHLLAVANGRPTWSRVPVSLAMVAEMEGNGDLALKHLREAFSLGNRQLPVMKALVTKLSEKQLYKEADNVLSKLAEFEPIHDTDLQMRFAEASFLNQKIDQALELTRKAVSSDSKDYKEHLWQGQMLAALGREKDAESAIRTAIRLAEDSAAPWMALVQLQVRAKSPEKAEETLKAMKAKVKSSQLPFALAHCYQIMGEKDKAEKALLDALSVQNDDLARRRSILENLVTFQINNGKFKEAEKHLRELLESKTQAPEELKIWSRRTLAAVLMSQPNPDKQAQAMSFIEENLRANPSSADDQIIKGSLLAVKAEHRSEAIKTLEKAFKAKQPTAEQMLILANLYNANGDWPKARNYMATLLSTHANDENYLIYVAGFVDQLLIHDNDAEFWLNTLQTEIRNELDAIKSEQAKAHDPRLTRDILLLSNLARRHPRLADTFTDDGELVNLFKSLASKSGKKENLLVVADFLGACRKTKDALDLCEQVLKELPQQKVVAVAVMAVANNDATRPQIERVETWVRSGLQKKPQAEVPIWDGFLAVLKERQGKFKEAEDLYRKMIDQNPKNIMAVNNLAFLLGLQAKSNKARRDEANDLIKKAIGMAGPAGELLDSRAVIYRVQGKLPEAEKDLKDSLNQQKTAYRLFHLYEVQQSAGKTKESIQVFREAVHRGLHVGMIHPLERESYEKALQKINN